jgi:hypothetical protein
MLGTEKFRYILKGLYYQDTPLKKLSSKYTLVPISVAVPSQTYDCSRSVAGFNPAESMDFRL